MRQLTCSICGAHFDTNKPNQKYCSFICREAGRRIRRSKWEEANPGYITEYCREYRQKAVQEEAQK